MQSGHYGIPLCIKGGPSHSGKGGRQTKLEKAVEQAKLGEVETYKIYIFKVLR
jgi:hypothetical protein